MTRNELKQLVKDCLKSTTRNDDLQELIQNMNESKKLNEVVAFPRFRQMQKMLETKLSITFNEKLYENNYDGTLGEFLTWLIEAMD
jgi:hypothetical protein